MTTLDNRPVGLAPAPTVWEQQRDAQDMRREGRQARRAAFFRGFRDISALLVVNAFAVLGQYLTGVDNYSPADWALPARIAVAIGAALGFESISLYVQWHAHDALRLKATHTAARMRRGAYMIAFGAAAVSYHHFADGWLHPTPASIVFATFSAVSPWLWGLHTRRVNRIQLLREGQVDSTGAVFSAERWRAYPIRTWKARRLSIDLGITDPLQAWAAYKTTAAKRAAAREQEREQKRQRAAELAEQREQEQREPETDLDIARRLLSMTPPAGSPTLAKELRVSPYYARELAKLTSDQVTAELIAEYQEKTAARRPA